jgi:protein-L-isoaspartate(D-aspartate) O-methyltransferase
MSNIKCLFERLALTFTLISAIAMVAMTTNCAENTPPTSDEFARLRLKMVQRQLRGRDIVDERVLSAMSKVPRHLFIPAQFLNSAYDDHPLPIGYDQTISQPYIVAYMTQVLSLQGGEKVLEIGTGSGYQAAILEEMGTQVFTIEIVPELASASAERLKTLGYKNVQVKCGDGYLGWPEFAPFDAIIITAAPVTGPQKLLDQLNIGGRLVVPEGSGIQELRLYTKTQDGVKSRDLLPVRFVPMIHGKSKR